MALYKSEEQWESHLLRAELDPKTDILEYWTNYIQWTIQHNKAKTVPQQRLALQPLARRCMDKFLHDKRYHNDIRYLRHCILRAELDGANQALQIYELLERRGVGMKVGIFFQAYAALLERAGHLER